MKIAIIPARGGSKRIPRKNIKNFLGKPIIAYSIETALESGLFDIVMVSTDDVEIATISEQYGAKVPFVRSEAKASDFATTADVIEEVLLTYLELGLSFDTVCCIYPTAPFVNSKILSSAFEQLVQSEADSVFPIQAYNYSIWRSLNINKDGWLKLNFSENLEKRSQDLPNSYHDAGQFYWIKTASFLKSKQIFSENSKGIVVSSLDAHDIDTIEDWELAELKYQYVTQNKLSL